MFDPQRIASAEYAIDFINAEIQVSPFGGFIHNPAARRIHSTGLFFAHCPEEDVSQFFADLDERYNAIGLRRRWICGYNLPTFLTLLPTASLLGYEYEAYWAFRKIYDAAYTAANNIHVLITHSGQQEAVYAIRTEDGEDQDSIEYFRGKLDALDGREVVAWLDNEPVATIDFYIHHGVVRFTRIITRPAFRGQGIGTTMLQFIFRQPQIQSSDCIAICCNEQGPIRWYERLGFVRNNFMWILSK